MPNAKSNSTTTKFPSFNWMRGVSQDTRITVVHRFILLRLCLYRDEKNNGQCDPGYQTVADELGVGRATVFRAVDVAIKRGWLADFPKHGGGARRNFVFTFPDRQQSHGSDGSTVSPERRLKRTTVSGKRGNSLKNARQQSQAVLEDVEPAGEFAANGQRERAKKNGQEEYISEPLLFASPDLDADATPNRTPKASEDPSYPKVRMADLAAAFDEFWVSAPSREDGKGSKEKARKAYVTAVTKRGVAPDKITTAMTRYAATRTGKDPTFTKYPVNWLKDGDYDAEPSAGAVTIDHETGRVIPTPAPRRSGPQTEDELHPEDVDPSWARRR